jgi:hypothetical protein
MIVKYTRKMTEMQDDDFDLSSEYPKKWNRGGKVLRQEWIKGWQ